MEYTSGNRTYRFLSKIQVTFNNYIIGIQIKMNYFIKNKYYQFWIADNTAVLT